MGKQRSKQSFEEEHKINFVLKKNLKK